MFDYIIAHIRLRSTIDIAAVVRGFKPFEVAYTPEAEADCTFAIVEQLPIEKYAIVKPLSEFEVTEAEADCTFARTTTGYLFSIKRRSNSGEPTIFHIDGDTHHIATNIRCDNGIDISLLRFGLWIMFGVVLASKHAIAIHSSVIECGGRGVLFLGESGTGKSTHTRLWRENIEGASLLNDDSPIVRVVDGVATVFGSPWSGKTPCYRNLSYPIAGFCRLSQAPHNVITRLKTIAAIGALLPSCPPAFAHDEYLQDCICSALGELLQRVSAYHLECLPDRAAAELSHTTILGHA